MASDKIDMLLVSRRAHDPKCSILWITRLSAYDSMCSYKESWQA